MRELSARADSLAALEKRLDLPTPVSDSTPKTALQPPVEDVDLRRRPRDMDYRNVVSQSVATSSVGGTSFVGPRVMRTRKSVLPDTATISRVGPRETRTPQSTVTESTSRSVKRKVQVTEGTVAVPNSGKASVAAGPPSQHRAFSCPICGPISTDRSRHIDNHHVPWWVSPDRICLHCHLECNTVLRLLRRHGHRDCSTAYHAGYTFWAEWMDTALREVASHFGLTSLTDLLTLMCQQRWFPAKEVDAPTPAADLHMRAWATYTGREIPERYHLSPPNDVACLVSRPIVRQWVMQVPRALQEKLKDVSRLSVQEIDNRTPMEPLRLFDSHVHCDALLHKRGLRTWTDLLKEEQQRREMSHNSVDFMIYSCTFPRHWRIAEDILQAENVYVTVGLHPHVVSMGVSRDHLRRQDALLSHPKCVAAGEVGLDYHTHGSRQERREQQDYLRRFLPQVSHLPVVLHCRPSDTHPHQARVDLLELMQEVGVSRDAKIYIHSFCGDESDVRAWMSAYPRSHFGMGKNSPAAEVLSTIPLDRMLLESDAPYQCKTPAELVSVCRSLSSRVNIPPSWLALLTSRNARRFFWE